MNLYKPLCLLLLSILCFGHKATAQTVDDYTIDDSTDLTELEPTPDRPKIAVVLAGGGAKGVSHVAALKAIEDAGIPIDMVVGTSIGSIVGGMYCAGYSPDTMRTIIANTDWIKMITDNPDFGKHKLSVKKDNEQYVLRFAMDADRIKSLTGMGGVIEGRNVLNFFKSLTYMLPDSLDFQDLPIPFACVGTEAVNGDIKVFTSGNLPLAIRASMAIPTAFTPVTINDTVYVDGGVVDNFPVDIARQMGADIVIGVDLLVKQDEQALTNSAIDLLMNCVDFYSRDRLAKNRKDANIYIPIDVTGYTAASFAPEQLDTLMARGDYYVSLKKHELDSLGRSLNLPEPPQRIRLGDYSFASTRSSARNWTTSEEEVEASFRKVNDGSLLSSVNIGGRFDSKEYATVLAKLNFVLSPKWASLFSLNLRLGDRLEIKTDYSMRTFGSQRFGINYKYQKADAQFYNHGSRLVSMDTRRHKVNLYFTQEWHKIKYSFGMNFNLNKYRDILAADNTIIDEILGEHTVRYNAAGEAMPDTRKEGENYYFSYFLKSEFNSLDSQIFPHRGQRLEISGDLITDNLYKYKDKHPDLIVAVDWKTAFTFNSNITLIPHVNGRINFGNGEKESWVLKNMVGGIFDEMHYMQERTFAGVSKIEFLEERAMAITGATIQLEPFKSHFLLLRGDYLMAFDRVDNVLTKENHWGAEINYLVRTPLGPVGAKVGWTNLTHTYDFVINAGYYF